MVIPDETGDAVVTGSDYFGHDQLLALSWLGSGLQVRARWAQPRSLQASGSDRR